MHRKVVKHMRKSSFFSNVHGHHNTCQLDSLCLSPSFSLLQSCLLLSLLLWFLLFLLSLLFMLSFCCCWNLCFSCRHCNFHCLHWRCNLRCCCCCCCYNLCCCCCFFCCCFNLCFCCSCCNFHCCHCCCNVCCCCCGYTRKKRKLCSRKSYNNATSDQMEDQMLLWALFFVIMWSQSQEWAIQWPFLRMTVQELLLHVHIKFEQQDHMMEFAANTCNNQQPTICAVYKLRAQSNNIP